MKISDEDRIFSFLNAAPRPKVVAAIKKWNLHQREEDGSYVYRKYIRQGLVPLSNKPVDIPSVCAAGFYWVESSKKTYGMKQMEIDAKTEELRIAEKNQKHVDMEEGDRSKKPFDINSLSPTTLKCPTCKGLLYNQQICPGSIEGRAGYKIRLICENDVDHEILL